MDNFINALYQKIEKRSELVSYIAKTLNLERDSVSRRLNRKVFFTAEEVAVLSLKLGISTDGLIYGNYKYLQSSPLFFYTPMSQQSIDQLENKIKTNLQDIAIISSEPAEYSLIFTFPPLEFLMPYRNLLRFTYFKWGYYYIGPQQFKSFSTWKLPQNLLKLNDKIKDIHAKWQNVLYIWDISAIWSFVKDIIYFISIGCVGGNDIQLIKHELHLMLEELEKTANGMETYLSPAGKINIYISSVHIGINFSYFISEKKCLSSFHTYFAGTNFNTDYNSTMEIHDWIHSMKKVCTLISESGARERKYFFEDQHTLVDKIQ